MRLFDFNFEATSLSAFECSPLQRADDAVIILHGGGKSEKARLLKVAKELTSRGISCWAFDFYGQGNSPGILKESSLFHRFEQASTFWQLVSESAKPKRMHLWGFSMAGQTIADMLGTFSPFGICLLAPAAYGDGADTLVFNQGFTEFIHRPNSWESSRSFAACNNYQGFKMLVTAEEDNVIPRGIIERYQQAFTGPSSDQWIISGVAHQLSALLDTNLDARTELVSRYLALTQNGKTSTGKKL